jgi:hypothetical protein
MFVVHEILPNEKNIKNNAKPSYKICGFPPKRKHYYAFIGKQV